MTQEALKLALEALEIEEAQTHYPSQFLLRAITAIKEALAEHAMRETQRLGQEIEQEPLEYWNAVEGWVKIDEVREHFETVGCATIYKTAGEGRVPLCLAQPEQEPVAWVAEAVCDGQYIDGRPRKIWWECKKGVGTAFYTAPPQHKPLTNGEIYTAYITATNQTLRATDERLAFAFARAIEAAHDIKGDA